MRVLFFGTYDARSHPRVGVLRDGLREHGHDVEECNAPLGLDTAMRVSLLRQPWKLPLLAWRLTACWAVLLRRAWPYRAAEHRPDAVVVGYLGHFDVLLARRMFRRELIALDHLIGASETASDRGVDAGVRQRLLHGLDRLALSSADVVVVDTDEHLEVLPQPFRDKGVVVEVGAPRTWFDHASRAPTEGPLRVIFFGLFTPLQGAPTIGAAAAMLADTEIEFTMIGDGQDLAATKAAAAVNSRVRWLDWVPSTRLPEEVGCHHVCLGIFGDGPKAMRVVPNKVFQGAAAGCAIVTSDTEPQRRAMGDAAVFVPPADAAALARAIRTLADDREADQRARRAAAELAADRFTPAAVTMPLHELLTRHATTRS